MVYWARICGSPGNEVPGAKKILLLLLVCDSAHPFAPSTLETVAHGSTAWVPMVSHANLALVALPAINN